MHLRGGRYEMLGLIASGGMASVHLGRAVGAGGFERLVAIKTMHPHLASEPEFISMFLDEARVAARIRHPNVVGTIDVQTDEIGALLVMEYVEGPSLVQILRTLKKRNQPAPTPIMLRIFLDMLAGLQAAHELTDAEGKPLQLVHRDVSPQNILIGIDGIARITDFGVARAEARLSTTRGGQLKGKIGYMAPEQLRHESVDRRTDVYAAGIVLWELLAGSRLIHGDNEGQMLTKILESNFKSPREVNPAVTEALDAACMRALKRLPDERYPTAADFAEAIDNAAQTDGIHVASARHIATFVKELAAHVPSTELRTSTPPPAPISIAPDLLPDVTGAAPRSPLPSQSPAEINASAETTRVEPSQRSTVQNSAMVMSTEQSAGKRGRILVAVGLAVAVAGTFAVASTNRNTNQQTPALDASNQSSALPPAVSSASLVPSAASTPEAPTAATTPSAASSEASAPASSASATSAAASASSRATATKTSNVNKTGPTAPTVTGAYRPSEL